MLIYSKIAKLCPGGKCEMACREETLLKMVAFPA
jgi:hypothetical protein